jgi:8-oxo-dGTP diphosphatase
MEMAAEPLSKVVSAPKVGVAVVVWRDSACRELLLGLGHSASDRDSVYALPGGHWEPEETLAAAARRETEEEANVSVSELALVSVHEFYNQERRRSYAVIGFSGRWAGGIPRVMEPDRKRTWEWHAPERALELPLFIPDRTLIERCLSGTVYEEAA